MHLLHGIDITVDFLKNKVGINSQGPVYMKIIWIPYPLTYSHQASFPDNSDVGDLGSILWWASIRAGTKLSLCLCLMPSRCLVNTYWMKDGLNE